MKHISPIKSLERAIVKTFLERVIEAKELQAKKLSKKAVSGDEIDGCIKCIKMLLRELSKYL